MKGGVKVFLAIAAMLVLLPAAAFAQEGQIAGTVRDAQEAVMPGVTVEVTSPALIERVRSATTDSGGQYRITNLPVGTYTVSFTLAGFKKEQRDGVVLTSGFTAGVNATMSVGQLTEVITVAGVTPTVDVQNSREVISLPGDRIRDMPTSRNVNSLLQLTPGISSQYTTSTAQSPFGAPGVCVGGIGVFCNPGISGFNIGDRGDGAPFAGRVDEVAVYSGVLSASRIQAHYYAGQGPRITITRSGPGQYLVDFGGLQKQAGHAETQHHDIAIAHVHGQRSFNVDSPKSTSNMVMIQKRTTT